ncbi:MAG: DegT/DnrJ/EryC1/StrS family aminotransferase [Spirochaetaceae bacterium]|jgi:dTDP-4-amino-4,6-dideoxygalactose transaminase|nr:DegT/DnrJ/EryC1/StrS family aminotransferase [Spirochaetaceae bacterium]
MIHLFSPTIRRKEMDAVLTCMVDEKIGPGELSTRLTDAAKDFFSAEGAVALRSPVRALECALEACALPPDSGVILSALAPAWHYEAVLRAGCKPLVLDVSADTPWISAQSAVEGIRAGGRAVALHEPLGMLPDMADFTALGVPVIEDASQSVGAAWDGRKTGTFGVYTVVGLEERHSVTAGGGALLLAAASGGVNSPAPRVKRDWAALKKAVNGSFPEDLLPDINSALAMVQLKEFARNEERRREIRETYVKALMQSRHKTFAPDDAVESAVYGFPVVLSSGFKDVKHYAERKDVAVEPAFERSIVSIYRDCAAECPHADSLAMRCVLFPLYPLLSGEQILTVARVLSTIP